MFTLKVIIAGVVRLAEPGITFARWRKLAGEMSHTDLAEIGVEDGRRFSRLDRLGVALDLKVKKDKERRFTLRFHSKEVRNSSKKPLKWMNPSI